MYQERGHEDRCLELAYSWLLHFNTRNQVLRTPPMRCTWREPICPGQSQARCRSQATLCNLRDAERIMTFHQKALRHFPRSCTFTLQFIPVKGFPKTCVLTEETSCVSLLLLPVF